MPNTDYEQQIAKTNLAFQERAELLNQKEGWDYDELVSLAASSPLLKENLYHPLRVTSLDRIRHINRVAEDLLDWSKFDGGNLHPLPLNVDEVDKLISESENDYNAFEVLKMLCARWLEKEKISSFETDALSQNEEFWLAPYPLDVGKKVRLWLADVLYGKRTQPPKPKTRHTYTSRNLRVWHTVATVSYCGPKPSCEEHNSGNSACDIVAAALNQLGISHHKDKVEEWTFKRTHRIWSGRSTAHPFCQIPPWTK